jgi:diguanylate cyclase (GGDEF)-like protein
LAALCVLTQQRAAVAPALLGLVLGICSVKLAQRRGHSLAHTLVVIDWLLLGVVVVLSGGAHSWLLLAVPPLMVGHLSASPRADWPFLLAPALLLVIVVAIADPSLGGDKATGLARLFVLVTAGGIISHELHRPRQRQRVVTVDGTTGFYTAERLQSLLADAMREATAQHDPLSVVCVRLDHFRDSQDFLGAQGSELLVRGVARRLKHRLRADDTAFRVSADTFILTLPGMTLPQARRVAAELCHDVAAELIERQRQTLSAGASSFPTVRGLDALLHEAYAGTLSTPSEIGAAPPTAPAAAAN